MRSLVLLALFAMMKSESVVGAEFVLQRDAVEITGNGDSLQIARNETDASLRSADAQRETLRHGSVWREGGMNETC